MSRPDENNPIDCLFETPAPGQSKKRTYGSVTNLRSQKRRRISLASVDLGRELEAEVESNSSKHTSTVDRFVSTRSKSLLPLNITPRTRRISKQFGLIDDKVLNFRDDTRVLSSSENTLSLLRKSASSLFNSKPEKHPTSVIENLNKRKDALMVLDSPGVTKDPDAYPISWSRRNLIAVTCGIEIFYQNLDSKTVSHLCTSLFPGSPGVIQWGGEGCENLLASGSTKGSVALWDAASEGGSGKRLRSWFAPVTKPVRSLSWNGNILSIGSDDGYLSFVDVRDPKEYSQLKKHRASLLGLQWSTDGLYLASGDRDGVVHVWDRRAGKLLLDTEDPTKKIRHKASARALAWCPWQPDLLATGTSAPEGKIRIWSTSSMSSHSPSPTQTIPLNTSVLSLHWSPHCKELLSTHGSSFAPGATSASQMTYLDTPMVNSITVHQYPSSKRLMTLTNAHSKPVTHSCLSPNGESLFTVCPREETIKMWQVWSKRPSPAKKASAFDKYTIR